MNLDDFLPVPHGFSIEQTRERIESVGIQSYRSGESRIPMRSGDIFRYNLTLSLARGYAPAYSNMHEAGALSKFFAAKRGAYKTFLHVDPVSGSPRYEDFALGDGEASQFNLLDIDGLKAKYIQNVAIYKNMADQSLQVPAAANPFKPGSGADVPDGGINGIYPISLPQGASPPCFSVTPGEDIKIYATGSAVVEFVFGTPSGPSGKYFNLYQWYDLVSDACFRPSGDCYGAIVGVFATSGGAAISVIVIGSGGNFVVPAGATKLFVGTNCYWYGDNTGEFEVHIMRNSKSIVSRSDYSINRFTGEVTFNAAPASGVIMSWSGVCAKEVRFEDSTLSLSRVMSQIYEGGAEIKLITPAGL